MATLSRQPGPLAFGDFLEHLRRQGFTIGVDHHLRLQRLLTRLGGQCAPQDLKTLLCPVFATNEKEQQLFHHAFDSYFDLFQIPAAPEIDDSFPQVSSVGQEEPVITPGKPIWRSPLGYTVLAVLLITLAVFATRNPEIRRWFGLSQAQVSPSPVLPASPEPSTSASTAPSTEVSPSDAVSPLAADLIPQLPVQSASGFLVEHRNAVRLASIVIPLLCFLIYEWVRYRRRKLILERARSRKPPRTWPIAVQAPELPELKDYRSGRFYRTVRGLRRRQVGEFHRLDVARTIAATIEARGYPNFRYRPDSRMPEYLVLIDRASWRDHQARLFDGLTRAMEREGLFVQRYFYDGDPRVCTDDSTSRAVHLTDLQKKYPSHRLLIFGDGEKLIDPVSGRLASWAALLLEWPDRAVLTPEARPGLREKTLADQFVLLPATLEGLSELAERFDQPAAEFDSWTLNGAPTPPDPEGPVKVEALRAYLGEESFQWLCACAVYPELHWELTLHLGSLPCMGAGLINEEDLLRLIRLPWFRTGSMPDELRLRLMGELEPQRERAVRSAIIELLEKNPPPRGTFAADARRLEIAAQRGWLSRDNRKELRREVEEIRKFPPNDIVRDYAFVRFLESAPSSRLAILLPRRLRQFFFAKGVSAFGVKSGVGAAAALIAAIVVWVGAGKILPVKSVDDESRTREMTLTGHTEGVNSVAFSPDGKTLASGSGDQTVKLWDAKSGEEEATLQGHEATVQSVAFSPDGKTLASASGDGTIKLWDRATGQNLATLKEHIAAVESVAFSPDGKTLASASYDRTVKLWDGVTRQNLATLKGHEGYVVSVAFSPDGKTLASASGDMTVKLWDGATGQNLATLKGHEEYVRSVAFSPDGKTLASASDDRTIKLWDGRTGQNLATLKRHKDSVSSVAFSPDGRTLASASDDRTVTLWDVGSLRELATLPDHADRVYAVVFSPDGKTLASGSADRTLRLWDVSSRLNAAIQSPTPAATASPSPTTNASPPPLARFSVTPRSLNFGTANLPDGAAQQSAPNVARTLPVMVTNTGTALYTIVNVSIGATRIGGFTIGRNSCSGANFQSRERCSIEVIFSPRFPGRYSTNLFINTTAGQQTVSLTGVAVRQPQSAPPTITSFTASPASVMAGEQITLCYEVPADVQASINPGNIIGDSGYKCYAVLAPIRAGNITYTLTATGRDGRTVNAQVTLRVRPLLPVEIIYFRAQPTIIALGGRAQLCYGVENAKSARIDQDIGEIKLSRKDCIYIQPGQTTTYTLTATGYDDKTVTQSFTLRVGTAKK